jgi:hypothetical protein
MEYAALKKGWTPPFGDSHSEVMGELYPPGSGAIRIKVRTIGID